MRSRLLLLPLAIAGLVAAVGACSVVDDGKVDEVNPPFGLDDTLPTTTTIATTTTELATTTSGLETTTTQLVQAEQVRLYFITGGRLRDITTQLAAPVQLFQIVAALQAGPPEGELGTGLRNALPPQATILVNDDRSGVATVDLPDDFFELVSPTDQRLVIAQLVLTLTESRGIGQVTFDQAVPKPSGELAPALTPLTYRDYESMLSSASATAPTTTDPLLDLGLTTTAGG